jgi:hypothetical protein
MKEICKSLRCRHYREDVEINCYFVPPDECLLKYNLDNFGNLFGRTTMINKTIPPIPINQQVVDLPTSRELNEKLKSVGVEACGQFCWTRSKDYELVCGGPPRYKDWLKWELSDKYKWVPKSTDVHQYIQTYTLTEMLSMLPERIEIKSENDLFYIALKKGRIGYWNHNNRIERFIHRINSDTNEPTAAAKLMIRLIDNKYVTGEI